MWEHEPKASEASPTTEDKSAEKLWTRFRDFNFDHLPVQVKIMAVWVALCYRYSPKMCVIGHRSGFIEAAALVGIPVFYLNNERGDIAKAGNGVEPGDLLWTPIKNPAGDRLRMLGDVMNTFVSIESLGPPESMDVNNSNNVLGERSPNVKSTNETSKTSERPAGRKEPPAKKSKVNVRPSTPGEPTLRVQENFKNELAAAFYMYMCCEVPTHVQDVDSSAQATPEKTLPAWTQRVFLMHGEDGRQWLEEKYDTAIGVIQEVRKAESHRNQDVLKPKAPVDKPIFKRLLGFLRDIWRLSKYESD